ncbi:MAG: cyclopropane mycolic acid synthase family methyltransferase [Mycobacterium sp.]
MVEKTTQTDERMRPHFEDIQAHYDISDDFFGLFLDPSRTYSCAYYDRDDMTLEEAQIAKIDLNLDKLDLKRGMTLLDVGCGWGSTMKRALEHYDVNVIGLTLSKNQQAYCLKLLDQADTDRSHQVLLCGWEGFSEPVDRIVSIEAIEHFGFERFDDFYKRTYDIMPDDGRMTIQSSTGVHLLELAKRGKVSSEGARFILFMLKEIFPGGRIPSPQKLIEHGEKAGFLVPECISLRSHYIRTLGRWASSLEANKDKAIEVTSEEVYNRYMKYLRGCHKYFSEEALDVSLVAYQKPGAAA